ncbi:cyclic nucleotide-binding domain-containing protein, partial [[Clostridium] innocuum]|nr:cyclic nucleotide-binding domain-containing protein [[Clostridium] innocuum]
MEKTAAAYIRKYRLDQILEERHVSMLELKTWKRRDILLHADTELHHLLFLVEGKTKTSYISANGQTVLHSFLYPLSILGEVELWKQMPVLNEVTALSEVITLQLPLVRCEKSLRQ